jgi:PAS domain S-box-containing protein
VEQNNLAFSNRSTKNSSLYSPLKATSPGSEIIMESLVMANTPIVILDRFCKIVWVSDGFTRLSGYALDECLGVSWQAIRKSANFYRTVIEEKQKLVCSYKNYTFGRKMYWTQSSITPVLNADGDLERIVIVETEITEIKQREEELITAGRTAEDMIAKNNRSFDKLLKAKKKLERSVRTKELFFAQMSHEIRTLMNGVIGLTEVLLKTGSADEQNKYLNAMKISGDSMLVVINDILDFSQIDAGKLVLKEAPFSLLENLNALIHIFSSKAAEKNIYLKNNIETPVPEILIGDSFRLNQILMNLISNAIKFTYNGGVTLEVRVKEETDEAVMVEFCVSDTGCGIADYKVNSLFSEFYQAHELPHKYEGTGLGLSITKKLIELQGGTIQVKSRENEGSNFIVELSFRKYNKQVSAIQNDDGKSSKEFLGLRALLAEDTAVNQLLTQRLLNDLGITVDIAKNGKIAIEKLKEQLYDMVLMDIKMPEMDGYEATHYIRTMMPAPVCNVPIIALTAYAGTTESLKCLKMGMNDHITKPFDANALYKKIKKVIKSKEQACLN